MPTDPTILNLIDDMVSAALNSSAPDGGQHDVTSLRATVKDRLGQIYAQGSRGGLIQTLIGNDVLNH